MAEQENKGKKSGFIKRAVENGYDASKVITIISMDNIFNPFFLMVCAPWILLLGLIVIVGSNFVMGWFGAGRSPDIHSRLGEQSIEWGASAREAVKGLSKYKFDIQVYVDDRNDRYASDNDGRVTLDDLNREAEEDRYEIRRRRDEQDRRFIQIDERDEEEY